MRLSLLLFFAFLFQTVGFPADIYVPDDYGTIQEAVNAASDGDTVLVRPGTYVEAIDIDGSAIFLRSTDGASMTCIDAGGCGLPGVSWIYCGSQPQSIEGFTISNATGPGIHIIDSDPVIQDNIIIGNEGGIWCFWQSSLTIRRNHFEGNAPGDWGWGGAIHGSYSTLTVVDNVVLRNSSIGPGGGISCGECAVTLVNNVIAENSTVYCGGGIYCDNSVVTMTNNTLHGNSAVTGGGGLVLFDCTPSITNSIFWDNSASFSPEIELIGSGSQIVTFCNVKNGTGQPWFGLGCIDADPLFADSANNDYHLTRPSPCRNTADNSVVSELYDFEGDPRIHDGTVDMGADEFHLHLYSIGDVIPGSPIDVKVVGTPGTTPLTLGLGSGIQDPPQSTPYGDLWLLPPIRPRIPMPDIGGNGLSILIATIPNNWLSGEQYPFQVLAGSELTNLMVLTVE